MVCNMDPASQLFRKVGPTAFDYRLSVQRLGLPRIFKKVDVHRPNFILSQREFTDPVTPDLSYVKFTPFSK